MGTSGKPPLVAVVGPTGVGKTALSLRLAGDVGGEVVSADSRQIYRHMDIGTAKPSAEERALVPHHLLDVAEPHEHFSLALYQEMAFGAIDDILARGQVPLLVGGTGLYVRAVVDNLAIPRVPPHPDWRAEWQAVAESEGVEALHRRLQEVDPDAARRIDPRNLRRVIRALEVHRAIGEPFSRVGGARDARYEVNRIGLTMERSLLYTRIDARVDSMMARGLLDEVRRLLASGYSPQLPSLSGLGYRHLIDHLEGPDDLEEAVRKIKRDTRRYVQQQYNWFRLTDGRIRWFDVREALYEEIRSSVLDFLNRR
jgi:tRNA dimethylallyltransferase